MYKKLIPSLITFAGISKTTNLSIWWTTELATTIMIYYNSVVSKLIILKLLPWLVWWLVGGYADDMYTVLIEFLQVTSWPSPLAATTPPPPPAAICPFPGGRGAAGFLPCWAGIPRWRPDDCLLGTTMLFGVRRPPMPRHNACRSFMDECEPRPEPFNESVGVLGSVVVASPTAFSSNELLPDEVWLNCSSSLSYHVLS